MIMRGNGASKGIAIGEVFIYQPFTPQITETHYLGDPDVHIKKYETARTRAHEELESIKNELEKTDAEKAAIFSAQREILCDELIDEKIRDEIQRNMLTPDWAIETVYDYYERRLQKIKDPLIRERTADLRDVKNRLLSLLLGVRRQSLRRLEKPVVVAARDLFPSDTAVMDAKRTLGIVCETGGGASHAAIIARGYGIPAVLGIPGLLSKLKDGEKVVLDAIDGVLITQPNKLQEQEARAKKKEYEEQKARARKYLRRTPLTADGERIQIGLNIASSDPEDLDGSSAADFVGLFRTEFLYMRGDRLPTEEEQLAAYRRTLKAYAPRPVVLRTLDIGGDKTLPYFPLPKEQNPFLGKRALRLCFTYPELFRTQLRAALRSSVAGKLRIMLPMVSGIEDVKKAKESLERVKRELRRENLAFDEDIKLGVMIEIPSAAIIAELLAEEVDFASIGTNDLCQYLLAVDRMNPEVSEYYQSYHPALFRIIGHVAQVFKKAKKPLCLCGELGGDPLAAPVLIGLGMRGLSMSLSNVADVKRAIARFSIPEMEKMARDVQEMSADRAKEYLQKSFKSIQE